MTKNSEKGYVRECQVSNEISLETLTVAKARNINGIPRIVSFQAVEKESPNKSNWMSTSLDT